MADASYDEQGKTIFHAARAIRNPTQRSVYLEAACGGDQQLREQVESLISASDDAGDFLDSPPITLDEADCVEPVGQTIGPYKLLERIGEGGFGVVFMADQIEPIQRRVALKIIKAGMDTKQVIARFEAERQALALMDHQNIAKVLDAGSTENGRPYFVMELVRGIPITEYCDERSLSSVERLKLFGQICSAVQHAHQKGIIHRDIKPSNLLVYTNGDSPVAKVIDFGIAKATQGRLTDKTLFTQFRQFVGTPAYMSPEQAQMSGVDIDTRSDIYSLGVLLYELLTGKTPLDSGDLADAGLEEICRRIREDDAPTPSQRISSLQLEELTTLAKNCRTEATKVHAVAKGDLDWIVMKAIEKDRTRRYSNADALREDVERHLKGELVTAVPPSAAYLLRKFIRRNRGLLTTAMLIAATLLIALVTSSWFAVTANTARNQLADKVVEKEQAVERARRIAYASDMFSAHQALEVNNLRLARELLRRNGDSDGTDLRNWEWRALALQCQSDAEAVLFRGRHAISQLSTGHDHWLTVRESGGAEIRVWNAQTEQLVRTLLPNQSDEFRQVLLSPIGNLLFTANAGGVVRTWSVPDFTESESTFSHGSRIRNMSISADGKLMAILGVDDRVSLWNLHSQNSATERAKFFVGDKAKIGKTSGKIAISPDKKFLAIGLNGKTRVLNLESESPTQTCVIEGFGNFFSFNFSPDSQFLAMGRRIVDRSVYLYRVEDGECVARLEGHSFYISDVAFSPSGQLLASASADQTIRIWDVEERTSVAILRGHDDEVHCLSFSADSARLFSGSRNGEICVWNAHQKGRPGWPTSAFNAVPGYASQHSRASYSSDSNYLVTRNADDTVSLRSAETLKEIRKLSELGASNRGVCFSPVGSLLAAGDKDGRLILLDPQKGGELRSFELFRGAEISPIGYSTKGKRLLILAHDTRQTRCIICSASTGQVLKQWTIPPDDRCAAISPDGQLVATGHTDGRTRFWKVADPQHPMAERHSGASDGIAFAPDGDILVTGGRMGDAEILDVKSFSTSGRLRGHMLSIHAVAFAPDGRRVATGGGPGEPVKIWDIVTRQELMTLSVDGYYFRHVEWSPDGNAILAISGAGDLHVWRVPTVDQIRTMAVLHDGPISVLDGL